MAPRSAPRLRIAQVSAFTLGNTINGGLVGALGPSLASFETSTGIDQAGLARALLLNRILKLLGTFVWASYATRIERRGERSRGRGYRCAAKATSAVSYSRGKASATCDWPTENKACE